MANYIFLRGQSYYYRRRVPDYIKPYDNRTSIKISLSTKDEKEAIRKAAIYNDYIEDYWRSLIKSNGNLDNESEYQIAVKRAKAHGFAYKSVTEIAQAPLERIIKRVEAASKEIDDPKTISSILGGQIKPSFLISAALKAFLDFEVVNHTNKSPDQLRKWRNPKIKAVNNFIKVCGDLSVEAITRNDMLTFRSWWYERIMSESLKPNSPNKDFTHLRTVISFAKDHRNLDLPLNDLFGRMRFTEIASSRPPFETEFIQKELLNLNNLKGLDRECQLFLFAMADLGARPSEIVGLNFSKGDIRLDTDIPYIHIRAEKDKELKTAYSERMMPLVGSSLYAFQQLPEGFKHYYRKSDMLSSNLNKFLRNNGLLPTDDHSVYSLRHSFEDRLTEVDTTEKVQAALMGHKFSRERYGKGPSLEKKYEWMQKIAFVV